MLKQRSRIVMPGLVIAAAMLSGLVYYAGAQAPGVEIVRDRGEQFKMLVEKANKLLEEDALLSLDNVIKQLERKTCRITLPEPKKKALSDREVWQLSRAAHVRVGWHYLCKKCDKWHQSLAGGYFVNTNGAVATCSHVITKDPEAYLKGYLIAANEDGDLFPVTEVLASDELTDVAIIQVRVDGPVTALPLNKDAYPGDEAWCYSDPLGRSGYFSKGIVNRFYIHGKGEDETPRMEVSTDWAPGSSGSAVLDECGNAIGHVSQITPAGSHKKKRVTTKKSGTNNVINVSGDQTMIVFRSAARAADVLALVEERED